MWKYNDTDELYHYGVLGMKWKNHIRKSYDVTPRTNKTSKSSNKKEKLLTKKKIAIGAAAVASIVGGIYLSKKYIDKTNKKIAKIYADKIYDRATNNYVIGMKMNLPLKRYSSNNPNFSKNVIKTLDKASTNYNRAYDKINKAKFTDKVKNVYKYKRYGTIRGTRLSTSELRKMGIKTF